MGLELLNLDYYVVCTTRNIPTVSNIQIQSKHRQTMHNRKYAHTRKSLNLEAIFKASALIRQSMELTYQLH